jgi:general secretion pathway protein G
MSRLVELGFGAFGIGLLLIVGISLMFVIFAHLWTTRVCEIKGDTAIFQISVFDEALTIFHRNLGRYPSTEEGLEILVNMPERRKPLMPSIPEDPWGNDYVYVYPGKHNQGSFDVFSKGPDGLLGTEDDISYKTL